MKIAWHTPTSPYALATSNDTKSIHTVFCGVV
jgi:hypothetical protein